MRDFDIGKRHTFRVSTATMKLVLLFVLLLGFGVTTSSAASVERISLTAPDTPPDYGEFFGWSVTSADYNGDKLADIVVGNPYQNGEANIYYGKKSFQPTADEILSSPEIDDSGFGFYLTSGDTNNDGYDDLAVAMDWGVNKVYVYEGTSEGLKDTLFKVITPPSGYPAFGFGHEISLGDINGDGFSDLLIGACDETTSTSNLSNGSSYLYIYYGSESGIDDQNPSFVAYPGDGMQVGVSLAGDLNTDGFDDIVVSVANVSQARDFNVYVYKGSSNKNLSSPQKISIPTSIGDGSIIGKVASAGDLNGDGFDDLLVGNEFANGSWEGEGKAYVFFGSSSNLSSSPDIVIDNPNPQYNVRFGESLCGIKDFNFDGFDDILIGCPYSLDNGTTYNGTAYVYYGSPSGITNAPSINLTEEGSFGWAVSPAGDIKGNGQNFFIVGTEFGGAYLYALNSSNDTTPPSISICSPTPKQCFNKCTISVRGIAYDNINLSRVETKVNDCKWQIASGTSSWTSTVTLSKGENTIFARAIDTAGNTNETSVKVIVR